MGIFDVDSHKLMYHPVEVANWLRFGNSYPLHLEVGITNKCNHKCTFCTLDWITHGKDSLSTEAFIGLIQDVKQLGVKSVYFAGEGEPTLHKQLAHFVEIVKKNNMKASMSTNGSMVDEIITKSLVKNLSWIRFSLDAATQETHKKIHGTMDFGKIISNIERFVIYGKKFDVNIGIQMVLIHENLSEVYQLAKLAKKLGVHNFQVKPCHSHPKSSGYKEGIFKVSHETLVYSLKELETDKFKIVVRSKSMKRLTESRNYLNCFGFDFYILIDAKGNVVPCNIFYNQPEFYFGNINKDSIIKIWRSQKRLEIINNIKETNHCNCGEYRCRLDVINRYLWRLRYPEDNDEFI